MKGGKPIIYIFNFSLIFADQSEYVNVGFSDKSTQTMDTGQLIIELVFFYLNK